MVVTVSVVVPARNAASTLPDQLTALARQQCPEAWEVVLVDVASGDGTAAIAESFRSVLPALTLVRLDERVNAATARNVGVSKSAGDKLLFCDDDDVAGDGWVAAMAAALDEHDAVAGRRDGARLNAPWVQATRALGQEGGLQHWDNPPWLNHAGGGNLGVRRAVFDDVGGFDERFDRLEDTAFCFCLQIRGHRLVFVPEAVMHVRMRSSMLGIYRQARGWAEASVALHARFKPLGMPSPEWGRAVLAWPAAFVRLLQVRDRADFANWVFKQGWRVGRLRGSVVNRVFAP